MKRSWLKWLPYVLLLYLGDEYYWQIDVTWKQSESKGFKNEIAIRDCNKFQLAIAIDNSYVAILNYLLTLN